MNKGNLTKDKLLESFEEINNNLVDLDFNMEFVIVGGSAFILRDFVFRATTDIDLINKVDQGILSIVKTNLNIDINDRVSRKGFERIFKGWESEAEIFQKYSNLTVKVLSPEMLVATKFFTKTADRDITDMAYNGKLVNQSKLENIVIKIIERTTSVELGWMNDRLGEIVEFYKASGWDWNGSNIKKLL